MFTPSEIARLRRDLGLSVIEFARRLGVHRNAVYGWEQGRRHPRYDSLLMLHRLSKKLALGAPAK